MVLVERIAIHHRGKGPGVRAVPYICFSQIQPQQPIRFFSSIAASSTTTSLGPLLFRCCSTSKWLVPGRWAPHRERRTGPSSLSFSSLGGCHHRFTSTLVAAAAAVQPTTTTTARGSTTTTSTTDTTTPTSDDAPTSPLSSSLSPPEDPSSSLPWIQQVESLLAAAGGNYHHHNVMRAQRIYNDNYYHPNDPRSTNQQQQPTPTRTTTTERSENLLRPIQSQLFDAWMVHQNDAVAAVLRNNISSSQEEEEEENGKGGDGAVVVAAACHHKGPRVPVSSLSSLSFRNTTGMEQQQQLDGGASALQSIGAAAHNAHTLLEHMEAFFGTRYERMLQQQQQQKSLDDFNNTNDTAAVVSGPNNARRTSTGHVNPSRVTEDSDAMQRRCEAVLTAWAQTSSIMVHGIGHGRIVGGGDTVESAAAAAHGRRSWTRGVPQRAQFLLERMEAAGGTKTGMGGQVAAATAVPDVYATLTGYNRVLMTWAYSSEHLRGASAERLFAKLLACKSIASPNTESYRLMVWAWALSRDPRCAFSATGHLMKMLRRLEAGWEKENPDVVRDGSNMEPTIDDYHVVFQAWARSEEKTSPVKAHSLLKLLTNAYRKGLTMTQPDETCYRLVLQTAAQRPTLPDLGPLVVDDTLAKMRENYMVPDSECFSAAIRTWKNAALFQLDVSVTDQQASVRRAKELLAEIKVAHNQSTLVSVSVTTDNINDVLEVLTVSTHHRRIEQAEVLLAELEQGWLPGNELGIKPDADSYISTMRVWGTSESIDKVSKSRDILERAKDKLPATTGRSNAKNDRMVDVFDTFIDVCGSYRPTNDREGLRVLKECLDAVQMMRSLDNVKPHSSTYAALLRACAKLLPLGLERRTAVATIFNFCCDDGLVNENVLAHLRDSAPPDLFAELVLTSSETVEGTKVVPERWTRKALGGKVISVDGRKTTPLSVDGRLKSTLAMKEFKMRRLKDKRNQKLLRGGRLNIQKLPDPSPWRLYNN